MGYAFAKEEIEEIVGELSTNERNCLIWYLKSIFYSQDINEFFGTLSANKGKSSRNKKKKKGSKKDTTKEPKMTEEKPDLSTKEREKIEGLLESHE